MALLSTRILMDPSFLGVNRAGRAQGLRLFRTKPFARSSSLSENDDSKMIAKEGASMTTSVVVAHLKGLRLND